LPNSLGKLLYCGNRSQGAHQQAEGSARQKKIIDTVKYIKNNWEGIAAQLKHPEVSCSAEGHVSHIPLSPDEQQTDGQEFSGAEAMVQMRALRAGGGSVKEQYLTRQEEAPVIVELKQVMKKELKRLQKKSACWEGRFLQYPVI